MAQDRESRQKTIRINISIGLSANLSAEVRAWPSIEISPHDRADVSADIITKVSADINSQKSRLCPREDPARPCNATNREPRSVALRCKPVACKDLLGYPSRGYTARCRDAQTAQAVTEEVEGLYLAGPAGGGGVTKSIREVLAIASTLVPTAEIATTFEMQEARHEAA